MKKIIILSATLLLVFLVAHSWAVPIGYLKLTADEGTTKEESIVIKDNEPGDLWPDDLGKITYLGVLGEWDLNVTTGLYQPTLNPSTIDLNSVNALGIGTLDIEFTVEGYEGDIFPGFIFNVGGTRAIGGEVSFEAWLNYGKSDNVRIAELSYSESNNSALSFSDEVATAIPLDVPYSLTILASITHKNVSEVTSFDARIDPVPEPATIILFGAGLIGLAAYGRARKRKK